jgi:hypothetical protein
MNQKENFGKIILIAGATGNLGGRIIKAQKSVRLFARAVMLIK